MMIPGPFEGSQKKDSENKSFLDERATITAPLFDSVIGGLV